jgi:hypothetical protein
VDDARHGQEEPALHQRVIEEVHHTGRRPRSRVEAHPERHVTALGDARVGEQPPQVRLIDRRRRPHEHRQQGERCQQDLEMQHLEDQGCFEDREGEEQQQIEGDLGGRRGQERRRHRRRVGVGVGQPLVQREERQLDADPHRHEGESHEDGARLPHLVEALGQVVNVERPRHLVEQPDPDQQEGRADGADDQVGVGGHHRPARLAERDQDVGREGGDLEEDEDVEGIASDHNPEQTGEAEQESRVEEVLAARRYLLRRLTRADHQNHGGDQRDDHQHEGIQGVDQVLDRERPRPIAELVDDVPFALDPIEERERDCEATPGHRHREGVDPGGSTDQEAERRGEQRQYHLDGREVLAHSASMSSAAISSSSRVP